MEDYGVYLELELQNLQCLVAEIRDAIKTQNIDDLESWKVAEFLNGVNRTLSIYSELMFF